MKDLMKVGELTVEDRQPATLTSSLPTSNGKKTETVHELLLSNGSVVYQCMARNADDCTYTAATTQSVVAHQVTHGRNALARKAREAEDRLAKLEAAREAQRQRRSAGSKRGHANRVARKAQPPAEIGNDKTGNEKRTPLIGDEDLARQAQHVITAFNAMQECADEFQRVLIGYMRIAQVASEKVTIDPQIIAKAKQYDVLQAAMKGLNLGG